MNKRAWVSVLIATSFLAGCTGEYSAEKDFYQAMKIFDKARNTEIITPGDLSTVYKPALHAFQNIADKYPTSLKTPESLFLISWMQMQLKNYDLARAALKKITSDFSQFGSNGSDSRFQIGRLYEMEDRWKEAETWYWDTAEYHSLQKKGLYAPIYIYLHYKNDEKNKDTTAKEEVFIRARDYYKALLEKIGPIQMSATVRNYLALLYLAHGDWRKTREMWLAVAKDYPASSNGALSLMRAADLTAQKKMPHEAVGLYRRFLKQYRNHPFNVKACVQIGMIHNEAKDYLHARQWFQRAFAYSLKKDEVGQAGIKLLIGKTHQNEGQWEVAEKIYREIEQEYPISAAGLQVPLLIWSYHSSKQETEKADTAFGEAIARYNQLAQEFPRTKAAQTAKRYRNFLYGQKGDWNQVLANIDKDMAKEKRSEQRGNWLFEKAVITEKQLQDKAKAIDSYQNFLDHFPNHRLAGLAKSRLQVLTGK